MDRGAFFLKSLDVLAPAAVVWGAALLALVVFRVILSLGRTSGNLAHS